ncbi:MAG: ribosome biogenesis/translation initiation ATPase RLI [Theionarchaea archaeon]|nr:MAG: ATPase [Theionarchaea archaeon DG-70]MBU7011529.1 ribosome biogenesis/translation initiation ATPase RLI [Theionarchaea archaeon]
MRIAVLDLDKCQPKKCNYLCIRFCPGVRMGEETIVVDEDTKKPLISEVLCSGCGICVHKCPFKAITIVNLPEELDRPIHQFGPNTFRLYRLPIPRENQVLGLLGANGVGKTTAIRILSGEITLNLGEYSSEEEQDISTYFRGSELQTYFEQLQSGTLEVIMKPQQITTIPAVVKGQVSDVVEKMDERGVLPDLVRALDMEVALPKKIENLSGGELQRMALIVAMCREADVYYFDEPSSFLDINQRLNVSRTIRRLSEEKSVIVVEHDLALLDYLSDYVHILYGQPGVYGICSVPYGVRVGINSYLRGYLKEENVRFRKEEIKFDTTGKIWKGKEILLGYPPLSKKFEEFTFQGQPGEIHTGEVIGIIGPNAIGKSTFIKILAGVIDAEEEFETTLIISYKPQYLESGYKGTVQEVLFALNKTPLSSFQMTEIIKPLGLERLMDNIVSELSGGELQRLSIVLCLLRDADIYLLDEPSAYLDVEQRLAAARVVRRFMEQNEKAAMIVEHDLVSVDYISDRLIVFLGTPGVDGEASPPVGLRDGMNTFLKTIGITFRREPETGRPRANKEESLLDREQKSKGEYYYE